MKNSAENNNNDPVIAQRLISNSDDGNILPANVLSYQYPAKTVSEVEVDMVILD